MPSLQGQGSRPPLKYQRGIINALLSIEGHLVWLLNADKESEGKDTPKKKIMMLRGLI